MRAYAFGLLSAALLCSPVAAQTESAPAAPAAAAAATVAPKADRKICRSEVVTGSRLGKRKTCRTAREWAAVDAASKQMVRDLQRPGGHNGGTHATPRGPGNFSGSRGGGG